MRGRRSVAPASAWRGAIRRNPPLGAIPSVLRLRGRQAPVELDFRSWAQQHTDEQTADMLSSIAGVYTFHHDPGELSAAFVWEHTVRLFLKAPPPATVVRYVQGGWSNLTTSLERRVRALGVEVETGHRATELPSGMVILAVELEQARGSARRRRPRGSQRPHGLPGYRCQTAPQRSVDRLGHGRSRLDRALLGRGPADRASGTRADSGADADSPGRRRPSRRARASSAFWIYRWRSGGRGRRGAGAR